MKSKFNKANEFTQYSSKSVGQNEGILAISDVQHRAYEEIIELFAAGATPEKILKFRPSAKAQDRVRKLLAKNRDGTLTPEEHSELNQYGHF